MKNIEIIVTEKTKSIYHVHLLNTDAHYEFSLTFDLAEIQEHRYIMDGISHGEKDAEFVNRLKKYGNKLFNLLFSGEVGKKFKQLCKDGFCLRLRLPPNLETLPWEYLANEEEFLFKGRENFLIRVLSLEKKDVSIQKISPPIKVLVIISNPPDLLEEKKLDVVREKLLIKEALRPLIDEGRLAIKWEDEASLERIQDALLDFNFKPQIIHYTGHGDFDEEKGEGVLLLEDGRDRSKNVSGAELAEHLAGRDVRLIVLSGCQTAMAKTTDSFSSVAGALVKKGIPAVIAMQESIRDDSAKIFASRFYKALANDQSVDVALGEARLSMAQRPTRENYSFIDWGVPVLISSTHDLNLFNIDTAAPKLVPPAPKGINKGALPNPGDIFVGRQKEQRQIARALRSGAARCIMILGTGGIGKSSLAARAVEQSEEYFHAVLTIGCKSVPTTEQILLEINTFLILNGNNTFTQVMQMQPPLDISQKIEYLPQALNVFRYLIIFDNFEDMLDATKEPHVVKDKDVRYLLEILTTNLRDSRVMITSRMDFDFTRDERYQANILTLTLRELMKMEAFRLMENIPSLYNTTDDEKLEIFKQVGGNPYIIDLVANVAKDVPAGNVLADIKNIQNKFVDITLLNKLYEWLPDDETRTFFRRASVYRKPVVQDFLVAMGGSDERIGYLLHKSLLTRIAGDLYEMHTNTRIFAYERLKEIEGESDLRETRVSPLPDLFSSFNLMIDGKSGLREIQITAAQMYWNAFIKNGDIDYLLESRWFYCSAKEYNRAGELVRFVSKVLLDSGFIKKVMELNEETVESATGEVKASALHILGVILQDLGRNDEAMRALHESLKIRTELGDIIGIAGNLNELGIIYMQQGRYEEAVKMFQESLKINEELDEKLDFIGGEMAIPDTLHNLAVIYQYQGLYVEAMEMLQKSLEIRRKFKDELGVAGDLQELGAIYLYYGKYEEAMKMYQESLRINEKLGLKKGISTALHNLGKIYQDKGVYEEAVKMYQKSLSISKELGYESGRANTLHSMGMIHLEQGRYGEALRMFQESLGIYEKLGEKRGIAATLLQMGNVRKEQGSFEDAKKMYQECLKINEELGDKNGIADALHGLGNIHSLQGKYEEAIEMYQKSLKIKKELGDKRGMETILNLLGMVYEDAIKMYQKSMNTDKGLGNKSRTANILHQLGMIYQDYGKYDEAVKMLQESLKIKEESGDKIGVAGALQELGIIHGEKGKYEEAVKMFQESLRINEKSGDKIGVASALHNLSMVYQYQGRYEEAIEIYQKSLKIKEELGDKRGAAVTLCQLGVIYQDQGRYEEAVKMYKESLKIDEELGDKISIANILHQVGMIYQAYGKYDEAAKIYTQSLKIKEEFGDKRGIAITLHQLGMLYRLQNRYEEAVKMYRDSLKIDEELEDRRGIAYTLGELGNIYSLQGSYDEAVKIYQDILKIFEELRDRSGIAITLGQMGQTFYIQKNYKEALMNSLRAFNIFEELNSPYKDLAGQDITKLKEEIGEELFNKYYKEIVANEQRNKEISS